MNCYLGHIWKTQSTLIVQDDGETGQTIRLGNLSKVDADKDIDQVFVCRLKWYLVYFQDHTKAVNAGDHDFNSLEEFLNVNEQAKFSMLYWIEDFRSCDGFFYFKIIWGINRRTFYFKQKRSLVDALDQSEIPTDFEWLGTKKMNGVFGFRKPEASDAYLTIGGRYPNYPNEVVWAMGTTPKSWITGEYARTNKFHPQIIHIAILC